MKIKYLSIIVFLFAINNLFAQLKVILPDGLTINLNSRGNWEYIPVTQQNVKLADGRTITVYPNGSWKHEEITQEQLELITADSTKVIVYKNGKWKVIPTPPVFGTLTDTRDDKTYKTVKIGTQWWMAENIAYKEDTGCWAYNNDESNAAKYGRLYNWETAQNVCPAGWHLPSDAEWATLTNYIGGKQKAGGKMKATSGWNSSNTGTTNESGFNALPAGYRNNGGGSFDGLGACTIFWSSASGESKDAWSGFRYYSLGNCYRYGYDRSYGFSVRCSKD